MAYSPAAAPGHLRRIAPFAFIGGEEAVPAMFHLKGLAKLIGAPYWPVPPHIIPFPPGWRLLP